MKLFKQTVKIHIRLKEQSDQGLHWFAIVTWDQPAPKGAVWSGIIYSPFLQIPNMML